MLEAERHRMGGMEEGEYVCTVQWYIRRVIVSHVRCSSLLHTGQPCLDFARTIAVLNTEQLLV